MEMRKGFIEDKEGKLGPDLFRQLDYDMMDLLKSNYVVLKLKTNMEIPEEFIGKGKSIIIEKSELTEMGESFVSNFIRSQGEQEQNIIGIFLKNKDSLK